MLKYHHELHDTVTSHYITIFKLEAVHYYCALCNALQKFSLSLNKLIVPVLGQLTKSLGMFFDPHGSSSENARWTFFSFNVQISFVQSRSNTYWPLNQFTTRNPLTRFQI